MQTFVSTCHLYTYYRSIDSNHQKASFVGTRASAISPCHLDVAPAPVCRVRDLDQHTEVHTSSQNGMERLGIERHPCITLLPLCVFFSLSLSLSVPVSVSISVFVSLSLSLSPSRLRTLLPRRPLSRSMRRGLTAGSHSIAWAPPHRQPRTVTSKLCRSSVFLDDNFKPFFLGPCSLLCTSSAPRAFPRMWKVRGVSAEEEALGLPGRSQSRKSPPLGIFQSLSDDSQDHKGITALGYAIGSNRIAVAAPMHITPHCTEKSMVSSTSMSSSRVRR